MQKNLRVGVEFELSFSNKLASISDILVFMGFELFSFKMKKTTQIDILAITGKDIFVLELKRFSSRIEGGYSDRNWNGYSGERRYGVYNPIFQNGEHVRSLQCFFRSKGLDVCCFEWHNLIVVPDSCVIKCDGKYVVKEGTAFRLIYSCERSPIADVFYNLFSGG